MDKPLIFDSPEAKAFFEKQKALDEKINKIKENNSSGDADGLIKTLLAITYSFPSLTIDYLLEQTMAQIRWLQKMAAGQTSYSFNEKAYAAGNVKKGSKLDFFIK